MEWIFFSGFFRKQPCKKESKRRLQKFPKKTFSKNKTKSGLVWANSVKCEIFLGYEVVFPVWTGSNFGLKILDLAFGYSSFDDDRNIVSLFHEHGPQASPKTKEPEAEMWFPCQDILCTCLCFFRPPHGFFVETF